MSLKRTPPIAFHAMIFGPIDAGPSVDADDAASANAELSEVVDRVQAMLRALHPKFAECSFESKVDAVGTSELWFSAEQHDLLLMKRDLHSFAEAIRGLRPERSVYLWLRDADDQEYGVEVFRGEIKPDPYRRD